mgnify:CR=1 FL=1
MSELKSFTRETEDIWFEKYKPYQNTIDVDGDHTWLSIDGVNYSFETYGNEEARVKQFLNEHIWTLIEVDGEEHIVPGFHIANRLCHFICEIPFQEPDTDRQFVVIPKLAGEITVGDRIMLEHTDDPYTRLVAGESKGTVLGFGVHFSKEEDDFDGKIGYVYVDWDDGSNLRLIKSLGDRYKPLALHDNSKETLRMVERRGN